MPRHTRANPNTGKPNNALWTSDELTPLRRRRLRHTRANPDTDRPNNARRTADELLPVRHTRANPSTGRPNNALWTAEELPRLRRRILRDTQNGLLPLMLYALAADGVPGGLLWPHATIGTYLAVRHTCGALARALPKFNPDPTATNVRTNPGTVTVHCDSRKFGFLDPIDGSAITKFHPPTLTNELCTNSRVTGHILKTCSYASVLPAHLQRGIQPHFVCRPCAKDADRACNIATEFHERTLVFCKPCSRIHKTPGDYCQCYHEHKINYNAKHWLCPEHRTMFYLHQIDEIQKDTRRLLPRKAFYLPEAWDANGEWIMPRRGIVDDCGGPTLRHGCICGRSGPEVMESYKVRFPSHLRYAPVLTDAYLARNYDFTECFRKCMWCGRHVVNPVDVQQVSAAGTECGVRPLDELY